MAKQGFRIIDSDMHVMEPHDLWVRYLDDRYRDRAPRVLEIGRTGRSSWNSQGRFFPAFTDHPARAGLNKARFAADHPHLTRYASARARGFDPPSQLEAMDTEGIDVAIAFRTIGAHVIAIDDMDADLAAALCRAFNRWLSDHCSADPARLRPTALVPPQDPALAVREAEHAVAELGHVAIVLPSNPVKGRPWYHADYEPLWRAAADLNVPVAFHGIQGAYQEHLANRYLDSLTMMHASAHPVEMMLAMGGLVCSGAFDRYPGLRAAFLEATCAWAPWWLWRLDEERHKLGHAEQRALERLPSEYYADHLYVAADPGESLVAHVVNTLGDDNIVISTDWPHDDSSYPHAIDDFLAIEGVSNESKRKILWDNCARLYGVAG